MYRGFNIRTIFSEIRILNKKIECFIFIITITMFRHAIKFNYLSHKRIDYYSNHKNTQNFLLLQRRIKYFLLTTKIKALNSLGVFDNLYIHSYKYHKKIKSKITEDIFYTKPVYKYHKPISKIIMIQRNFRLHIKYEKIIPKYCINKISLNKCPFVFKIFKPITQISDETKIKNAKKKPIANKKYYFITKKNINIKLLIFFQKFYKKRYLYLKNNYKLAKYKTLHKTVINKCEYIQYVIVENNIYNALMIQKNIRYFLYRKFSDINKIPKPYPKICKFTKVIKRNSLVKEKFYEDFIQRIYKLIKKKFIKKYFYIFKPAFSKKLNRVKTAVFHPSSNSVLHSFNSSYSNLMNSPSNKGTDSIGNSFSRNETIYEGLNNQINYNYIKTGRINIDGDTYLRSSKHSAKYKKMDSSSLSSGYQNSIIKNVKKKSSFNKRSVEFKERKKQKEKSDKVKKTSKRVSFKDESIDDQKDFSISVDKNAYHKNIFMEDSKKYNLGKFGMLRKNSIIKSRDKEKRMLINALVPGSTKTNTSKSSIRNSKRKK